MQLGVRDVIATIGAAVAGYIGWLTVKGLPLPGSLSQRWTVVVLLIVGMAGCMSGGSGATPDWKQPMTIVLSVLGGAALLLTLVGLIKPDALVIELLAGVVVLMWMLATLRHLFA